MTGPVIVSRKESPKARAAREQANPPAAPAPVRVLTDEQKADFLKSRPDLADSSKS